MFFKTLVVVGSSVVMAACASFSPPVHSAASGSVDAPDAVWFTGASNIRHFACGSKTVTVLTTAAPEEFERTKADGIPAVRGAALTVPVLSIDCGLARMNDDLVETLGGDRKSTINFRLWNYVVMHRGLPGTVRMNGLLRIAGKEQMMLVYGSVVREETGYLRLRGERIIDVRDFGIKPPRRFFGLLHVRNEITVHFDVGVRPLMDPAGILVTASHDSGSGQ